MYCSEARSTLESKSADPHSSTTGKLTDVYRKSLGGKAELDASPLGVPACKEVCVHRCRCNVWVDAHG